MDDFPKHIRESEVTAGVAVGETLVVEAEDVQNRGVQVVDVDFAFSTPRRAALRRSASSGKTTLPRPKTSFLRCPP